MALRLKNQHTVPPGYFRFPRQGTEDRKDDREKMIWAGDLGELIRKVSDYRIQNGLPLGDVEAEVNQWLCDKTGADCTAAAPRGGMVSATVSIVSVVNFLAAMAVWLRNGGIESQEEANRRAAICAGCRFQTDVEPVMCFGCVSVMARVFECIGDRRTPLDEQLKFCGKCGCSNKVSVFAPKAINQRAHPQISFDGLDTDGRGTPCWKDSAQP